MMDERGRVIERIKALGLPEPVPLDKVACFLPVREEWKEFTKRKRRKRRVK